jgi:hypothetical protein
MGEWTKEPWQQGRLLSTQGTRRLDKTTRAQWDKEERKRVFANFSAQDEGRSRSFIAAFQSEGDAVRAIACVNALTGIEDPAALMDEALGVLEALDAVVSATGAYLPPDGISKDECINRILQATDNPRINAARENLKWARRSKPHTHVAGTTIGRDIDECAVCGADLRAGIHSRKAQ